MLQSSENSFLFFRKDAFHRNNFTFIKFTKLVSCHSLGYLTSTNTHTLDTPLLHHICWITREIYNICISLSAQHGSISRFGQLANSGVVAMETFSISDKEKKDRRFFCLFFIKALGLKMNGGRILTLKVFFSSTLTTATCVLRCTTVEQLLLMGMCFG